MGHLITALRNKLGPLWWHTGLMLGISQVGNLINLVIGLFLVPDAIDSEQLGAVLPLAQLSGFVAVPLAIVIGTGLRYVSLFQSRNELGKVKGLLRDLVGVALLLSVLVALSVWGARDFVLARLRVGGGAIIWLVAGVAVLSCWLPLVQMAAQGLFKFYSLIMSSVVGPGARLIAILLLLTRFQVAGYMGAMLISTASVVVFLGWATRRSMARSIAAESYRAHWPEMGRYLVLIGLAILVSNLQVVEPWVIRQRLTSHESAGFYLVAMFGNIPAYVAPIMATFLFPLVSAHHATGGSTRRMHLQSLGAVLVIGGGVTLAFLLGGEWIIGLRESWRPYAGFGPFIWQMALATTLAAFVGVHLTHENACGRFAYLWYYAPVILLEAGLLYSLAGWGFFKPHIHAGLWETVDRWIALDLQFVLKFMIAARVALCLGVVVQVLRNRERGYTMGRAELS